MEERILRPKSRGLKCQKSGHQLNMVKGQKKRAQSSTKVQRIGTISEALAQIQDFARNGGWERQIASVLDLLDTQLDPKEIEKAREVQMATLVEKDFAVPKLKQDFSKKSKLFH